MKKRELQQHEHDEHGSAMLFSAAVCISDVVGCGVQQHNPLNFFSPQLSSTEIAKSCCCTLNHESPVKG